MWLRPAGESVGVVVYIVVDDIDAVLEKVVAFGGEVVAPQAPQGSTLRAYFADPDGNVFGLWQEENPA